MITKLEFSMQNVFQLANIEKACFGRDAWSINNLRSEFDNDFSHFFCDTAEGKIVGYVCVRILCEEAQICNIAVLPQYRRQGIATRLLQTVAEFSQIQGCERCELEVNTANVEAVALYKKCGYAVEGLRKDFYRRTRYASRDAYTMVLPLVPAE